MQQTRTKLPAVAAAVLFVVAVAVLIHRWSSPLPPLRNAGPAPADDAGVRVRQPRFDRRRAMMVEAHSAAEAGAQPHRTLPE
jgi:hypothetical protein